MRGLDPEGGDWATPDRPGCQGSDVGGGGAVPCSCGGGATSGSGPLLPRSSFTLTQSSKTPTANVTRPIVRNSPVPFIDEPPWSIAHIQKMAQPPPSKEIGRA